MARFVSMVVLIIANCILFTGTENNMVPYHMALWMDTLMQCYEANRCGLEFTLIIRLE